MLSSSVPEISSPAARSPPRCPLAALAEPAVRPHAEHVDAVLWALRNPALATLWGAGPRAACVAHVSQRLRQAAPPVASVALLARLHSEVLLWHHA